MCLYVFLSACLPACLFICLLLSSSAYLGHTYVQVQRLLSSKHASLDALATSYGRYTVYWDNWKPCPAPTFWFIWSLGPSRKVYGGGAGGPAPSSSSLCDPCEKSRGHAVPTQDKRGIQAAAPSPVFFESAFHRRASMGFKSTARSWFHALALPAAAAPWFTKCLSLSWLAESPSHNPSSRPHQGCERDSTTGETCRKGSPHLPGVRACADVGLRKSTLSFARNLLIILLSGRGSLTLAKNKTRDNYLSTHVAEERFGLARYRLKIFSPHSLLPSS